MTKRIKGNSAKEKKLKDFEEVQRIASKSKLSLADVKILSIRVEKDFARHAKRLLDENKFS